ncbi:YhaN family protein [Polyangium sp. y55x31]|uniref:YhaN family protein n=1 Tax=Polyangium sp. y55x31 TaxID=3042688 RepID=UPI0024831D41|nr:YhaN family protein [Polyangium sp. y55x31]MDI1478471.1 AAA family ATPase [Polyangium sp. y55x31]
MKILALELLRWGPFSDLLLDFSSPARALHVVVGSNEAGKSTTLRAVTGLFFGIPERTADDHRHKKPDLRIGGRIGGENDEELSIVRTKGRKNTLRDRTDAPIEEEHLRRLLGNLEQGQFETMFGLSHDRLVEGGRALVEGRGDLGESLFGAGLGQTGLSSLLRKLEQRAEEIFVPRGRTKKLNHVIEKFKKAKDDQKTFSQPVRAWEEHKKELDVLRERAAAAQAERESLLREHRRLSRIKRALRPIAERTEILLSLEARRDVVLLPETAAEDRRRALAVIADAGPWEDRLRAEIAELEGKLASLDVPAQLLDKAQAVRKIQEDLGSHRKASGDGSRLRGELRQIEDEVRAICARLGRSMTAEQAEAWRLPAALELRVRGLVKQHVALDAQVRAAESALATIEARLAEERQRGAGLPPLADVADLGRAVERAQREGDLDKLIRERERVAEDLGARVRREHAALALFELPFDRIGALPLPARETIERFERVFAEDEAKTRGLSQTLADRRKKLADVDRELERTRRGGAVPTEDEVAAAREHRDALWVSMRRSIFTDPAGDQGDVAMFRAAPARVGIETVLDYEARVRHADDLAKRLFHEADRVAKVSTLSFERASLLQEIEDLSASLGALASAREAEGARWQQEWSRSGITPLSPAEMKGFLVHYEKLADDRARWMAAEAELASMRTLRADHEEALARLLGAPLPGEASLSALLERARSVCERAARARTERESHDKELARRAAEAAQLKADLAKKQAELDTWSSSWAEAMQSMDLARTTRPDEAEEVLRLWAELTKRCEKAGAIRHRIAGIEQDSKRFSANVLDVVRVAAPDLATEPTEQAADMLVERFSLAEKDDIKKREVTDKLDEKRRELEDVTHKRKSAERKLAQLFDEARATSVSELVVAEERSKEVRDLRARLEPLERQLLDFGEGLGLEALVAECQGLTGDDVATALRAVEEKITAASEARANIDKEIGKLEERLALLDGSGKAAEAAEEAEQHLAAMATLVEEYARARLAYRLLEDEIKQYREKHQGPIVRRASELFERLTLGSFVGIRGDDEGEEGRPILKCVRPAGGLVGVEGLSDGTRDQLFFALRMASLERHFEHNEPIPFVLDDILVNFDDARSRAALSILGELSQKTQVLFFTHHARVADLAREAVPPSRLCLHDLDTLGGRARLRPAS